MKDLYIEKIGNLLKKKREERGLNFDQISKDLKINPAYLSCLEEGDIKKTPALVFFKGFLKNYGNYLGLDGEELVNILTKDILREKDDREYPFEESVSREENKKRIIKISFLAFIAILIIFSWARVYHINYKKNIEIEKRKASNFNALTTAKEMALHEEKKRILTDSSNISKEDIITIKVNNDSWVELIFDNNKIFQGLLFKGEKRDFPYKKGMRLKLGNAGGVELLVKGVVKKDLGKDGEVKEILID
ncbi:MAG: DUF4115 domain-containing protein [Proteobacteria bacterium]|nr:DUF4115 domain-containing protein [Pseudomonadota bacterium]